MLGRHSSVNAMLYLSSTEAEGTSVVGRTNLVVNIHNLHRSTNFTAAGTANKSVLWAVMRKNLEFF